jgi:HPt (histidine-containing phosphotransfer) domain-containing protein
VKDVQAMPGQLQGLAQQTDAAASRAEVQRVLHTLKGLAATLGAVALSAQAAAAEKTMAKSPDSHPLEAVIQQACGDIDKALPGLQTLLQALQDDQARTAEAFEPRSSTPAAGPALVQALVSALQAMVQLLEDGDMDAMHAMAELQQQFGQALGERVAPLEEAMADLNFEQALPLCQELLAHYTAAAVAGA